MSKRHAVLLGSLALNVCCLSAGVHLWTIRSGATMAAELTKPAATSAQRDSETPFRSSDQEFQWSQVESTNYPTFIGNLRKIACPEGTIDDIVVAEIVRVYAPKVVAAHQPQGGKKHYWESSPSLSSQNRAAESRVYEERNTVIKELVGIDLDQYYRKNDPSASDPDGPLAFLPEEKQQALGTLQNKYQDLKRQIYANSHGLITEEDRAALAALEQQKGTEMDSLLTPTDQFENGLRNSPQSAQLRRELAAFQPTEVEYRAIYQTKIAFEEKAQANQKSDSAVTPEEELQTKLKQSLGEQRYAEYQRSKDPDYQTLFKIADRFGLEQNIANQVLDLKQNTEFQKQRILTNTGLDDGQKQGLLQTLQDQTGATLSNMLGDSGFNAYHEYGGAWIDRLRN